ncbi:hypothetical protein HRbin36_02089 [bacterium HR36]|nr:hypothetical protein HRbin36_02089 [bacterium HR36]
MPIGHRWLARLEFELKIPAEFVDGHFQVQLAHAAQDQFAGFGISTRPQGGIIAHQSAQGLGQFAFISMLARPQGLADNRLGETDFFENHRGGGIAQRMTGGRVFQPYQRHNFASTGGIALLAARAHDLVNVADPFGFLAAGVVHRHSRS